MERLYRADGWLDPPWNVGYFSMRIKVYKVFIRTTINGITVSHREVSPQSARPIGREFIGRGLGE